MIVRIRPYLDIDRVAAAFVNVGDANIHLVEEFEKAFAAYMGVPYAIAVNQGRSALLMALKVLGLKSGDEVIVQSYIFYVVIDAILEVGAKPVIVDSGLDDFNISPEEIKKAITPRTKAIIATHLGIPCDIEEISGIAGEHNCFLIENCAHTLGARYNGKNVGTFGDISFYSFDVDKPISTGDGGMLVINNICLIEKAKKIAGKYSRTSLEKEREIVGGLILQHFATSDGIYPRDGFLPVDFGKNAVKNDRGMLSSVERAAGTGNYTDFQEYVMQYLQRTKTISSRTSLLDRVVSRVRGRMTVTLGRVAIPKIDSNDLLMNSLRSAVGLECLKEFDAARQIRDQNTRCYRDSLDASGYGQPAIDPGKKPAFIRYAVMNNTRHENSFISSAARKRGFELGIFNWSTPIHLCWPYNKLLSFDREKLRNSELLSKRLLSLPVHPYIGENTVKKISRFLNEFVD